MPGGSGEGATPPYSLSHSGPVLVCGNAWCLFEDIERAQAFFGPVPAIAVNGAAQHVKAVALYSKHPRRFVERGFDWIDRQQRRFGDGFTVHGSRFQPGMPWVDHWWEDARGGGGSAWGARKIASLMGFAPVILCGAPLVPGGYAGNPIAKVMRQEAVVENLRREIESDADWHEGVLSMSGWTAEFLGRPC